MPPGPLPKDEAVDLKQILENIEAQYIHKAYETHKSVRKAAKSLSMDAATYLRRRQKYAGKPL